MSISSSSLGNVITSSPRRIVFDIDIYFTHESVVKSDATATIWLPTWNFNYAQTKRIRNTKWTDVGSFNAAEKKLSVQIMSPVDAYTTTEFEAFTALSTLHFDVEHASPRSWVREVRIRLSYRRMYVVYQDATTKTRAAANSDCTSSGTDRFLMDFLKPYERSNILATLPTSSDWWTGATATDQRPANSFYCYKDSPDYIASECKNEGYYSEMYVDNSNVGHCSRPSGFSCLSGTYDFDGTSNRLQWSGTAWRILDRDPTASMASVCCGLQQATIINRVPHTLIINGSTPSKSLMTQSSSSTPTSTETSSISTTQSSSISSSPTSSSSHSAPTPSISFGTESFSSNESLSSSFPTPSITFGTESFSSNQTLSSSHESSTFTKSTSSTITGTRTPPPTPTRTFSRTVSRSPSVSNSGETDSSTRSSSKHTRSLSSSVDDLTPSSTHLESETVPSPSLSASNLITMSRPATKSNTIPLPKKPVAPALEDVQTFTMVASIAGGASVVAVARARLEAALQLSRCGSGVDLEEDMDALDNPLGIKFGTGILQSQRGAAFGNIYVVAVFGAFLTIVAVIVSWYSGRSFWNAMQRVRMPGILILILQVITPGTAQATASLWQYGPKWNDITLSVFSSVTVVFGPLILVLLVTLPGFCKSVLYPLPQQKDDDDDSDDDGDEEEFDSEEIFILDDDDETSNNNSNKKKKKKKKQTQKQKPQNQPLHTIIWKHCVTVYNFLLVPKEDWFDQDVPPPTMARQHASIRGDESERGLSGFTLKYGVIFEDFDRPLFGFFDLLVSTVLGGTAGFAIGILTRPTCLLLLSVATFSCFAHLVYLVYRRPCLTRLMQVYMVANSFFTFLTVIFSTMLFLGQSLNFEGLTTTMLDLQTSISLLTALLQIVALFVFFFEAYDAFRQGRDAHKRTKNATFNLEDLLLEDNNHNNNENNDGGLQIDLSEFLNGDGEFGNNNNEDELMIDLTDLLEQDEEEDLNIEEFLNANDENETEVINVNQEEEEEEEAPPTYELEDEDDEEAGKNKLLNDDYDGDEEIIYDEDGRPIGKASRANAAQHAELTQMLSSRF